MDLKQRMDQKEELKRLFYGSAAAIAFVIGLASGWTFPIGTLIGPVVLVFLMNGLGTAWFAPTKTRLVWFASAIVGQSGTIYLISESWKTVLLMDIISLAIGTLVWAYERRKASRAQ